MRGSVFRFEEMVLGPFAGLRQVPADGHRWDAELQPAEGLHQDPRDPGGSVWLVAPSRGELRRYAPLAVPNLHRRFAALRPTPERIKAFADPYGRLGHGTALTYPDRGPQPVQVGESLAFWAAEISRMARLVTIWDLVRRRNAGKLGQIIVWRGASSVSVEWQGPGGDRAHRLLAQKGVLGDELLERWRPGDVIEPARYYVCLEINEQMRGHVSPAVLPFRQGDVYLFPDCLLAALYVLFALEVSGKERPAQMCRGCGRYFIPQHGSQKYCEGRCRKRRYYHQRKEAQGGADA